MGRGQSRVRLAFLAVLGLVIAGGVAYAAIPGGTGVISGCFNNVHGGLRMIDTEAGDTCKNNETAISWNQQGPPGPQGPPGVTPGPAERTVDCSAGETVSGALAQTSAAPSVTITIRGTCAESIFLRRDNVTLQGAMPADGLSAPGPGGVVLSLNGAQRTQLRNMKITGGSSGIWAVEGARFSTFNLSVHGFSNTGILVGTNSVANLSNTTVTGGKGGVDVGEGATATINGGTISGARFFNVHARGGASVSLGGGALVTGSGFHGAQADTGGSITVGAATIQDSAGTGLFAFQGGSVAAFNGSLIKDNRQGGVGANAGVAQISGGRVSGNSPMGTLAYNGGALTIQDGAVVEDNTGSGVQLGVASTLAVQQATIRRNTGHGISANDTSVIGGQGNEIVDNGGWGVWCQGPPAVAMISTAPGGLGNISGNAAGDENCPNA